MKDLLTVDKIGIVKGVIEAWNDTVNAPVITNNYCRAVAVRLLGPKTKLFL